MGFFLPLSHKGVLVYDADLVLGHDSVDGVLGVDGLVEGDSGTATGFLGQDDRATRVLGLVLGHIVHVVVDDDPQVFLGVMLCHLLPVEYLL